MPYTVSRQMYKIIPISYYLKVRVPVEFQNRMKQIVFVFPKAFHDIFFSPVCYRFFLRGCVLLRRAITRLTFLVVVVFGPPLKFECSPQLG